MAAYVRVSAWTSDLLCLLLPISLLLLASSTHAAEDSQVYVPVRENIPLHQQTLKLLQSNDSVLPPQLDVHPVTAMYNREAIIPPQCYTRT